MRMPKPKIPTINTRQDVTRAIARFHTAERAAKAVRATGGKLSGIFDGDEFVDSYAAEPYYIPVGGSEYPSVGQEPTILDQLLRTGQSAVEMWLTYDARKDMQDMNIERARRGLPPVDASAYMRMTAPQVQFGMSSDTKNLVMYGGIGVLAVMVLSSVLKSR